MGESTDLSPIAVKRTRRLERNPRILGQLFEPKHTVLDGQKGRRNGVNET